MVGKRSRHINFGHIFKPAVIGNKVVAKLWMKLARYSSELKFVFNNGLDWASRARLAAATARFHLHNALGKGPCLEPRFPARLRVENNFKAEIELRPLAGDIFVLFEVLMDKCYSIPDAILDPKEVRVIVDCGANIGMTSLFFASRYPNAHIYSIEPDRQNFEFLTRNTSSISRIVPIYGAIVGSPRNSVRLTTGQAAWGNAITEEPEGLEVPAFTINQICNNCHLSRVDLLKMDVEGAEKDIFAHGSFLERTGFLIIELHGDYDIAQLSKHLTTWSFVSMTPKETHGLQMIVAKPMRSNLRN